MKKKYFTISIFSVVCILLIILLVVYRINLKNSSKEYKKEEIIKDIKFEVYSNQNNKIKVLVTAQDTENGIERMLYTNKGTQTEIRGQGKKKIAVDYEVTEDGNYQFIVINGKGERLEKTLNVNDEYRKNLINIQVETKKDIDTNGTVNINYNGNENKKKMYKIGSKGDWKEYTGQFTIDSYDIIKNSLQEDETNKLIIYAKIQDNADNIVLIQKEILNIDVDIAKMPVITYKGNNETVKLTEYGTYINNDVEVEIRFDTRDDIENYYSIDNGRTWKIYNGNFVTNEVKILAKSIKNNSGLEISKEQNCNDILSDETILAEAYDENSETCTMPTNKYIELSDNLIGKTIKIDIDCPEWNHVYATFFKEDKRTAIGDKGYWHTSYSRGYMKIKIPEGAKYLGITKVEPDGAYYCNLYNIEIDSEPIGNTVDLYPHIDLDGIKNENKYKIQYFETAVKKLYSYDNVAWEEYPEDGINLKYGKTVYAKSIDKNGKESNMMVYKNELTDVLEEEAYDDDETTKTLAYDKILYVNSDVWNKKINVKFEAQLYSRLNIRFLNDSDEIINEYSNANGSFDLTYTIPENTKKITWKYTDGNRANSYIYEIKLVQN